MSGVALKTNGKPKPKSKSKSTMELAKHHDYRYIKQWTNSEVFTFFLQKEKLEIFAELFSADRGCLGVNGKRLLELNREILLFRRPYKLYTKTLPNKTKIQTRACVHALLLSLSKLQIANIHNEKAIRDLLTAVELSSRDFHEMKRRFDDFIDRYEKILWIQDFVAANHRKPEVPEIMEVFGITFSYAALYLKSFEDRDEKLDFDLHQLFDSFNVSHDCVIWWALTVNALKLKPRKSIWIVFHEVAKATPANLGVQLLRFYGVTLTRFSVANIASLCKNITLGSRYPICAALAVAHWLQKRGNSDVSRGDDFKALSSRFVQHAIQFLGRFESDHIAMILLEMPSDIDRMSAIDMAIKYQLFLFTSNNKVERMYNSLWTQYNFLDPKFKDLSFQIDTFDLRWIWGRIKEKQFYFTPIGLYITNLILFLGYLGVFTFLSLDRFKLYDTWPRPGEVAFWVCNIGFVLFELTEIVSEGMQEHFKFAQNQLDFILAVLFIMAIVIRTGVVLEGQQRIDNYFIEGTCEFDPLDVTHVKVKFHGRVFENQCIKDLQLPQMFEVIWTINCILLWLRLLFLFTVSDSLGPMVRMLRLMMDDIVKFGLMFLVIYLAWSIAFFFALNDDINSSGDYGTFVGALLMHFDIIFGNIAWTDYQSTTSTAHEVLFLVLVLIYIILSGVVLVNLLIALMAKTFDSIEEDSKSQIVFLKFQIARDLDQSSSFIPPPLNLIVYVLLILFYILTFVVNLVYWLITCWRCFRKIKYTKIDLTLAIMPGFMKKRRLEVDYQIIDKNVLIKTGQGLQSGVIFKYYPKTQEHEIAFKDAVTIGEFVTKRHTWRLDLFALHERGLLDLTQFEADITAEEAEEIERVSTNCTCHTSDIIKVCLCKCKQLGAQQMDDTKWICQFCRQFVQSSPYTVKRLCRELNVSPVEARMIQQLNPVVCPNCYRRKQPTKKWILTYELLSMWVYVITVRPLIVVLVGLGRIVYACCLNPKKCRRLCDDIMDHACCKLCCRCCDCKKEDTMEDFFTDLGVEATGAFLATVMDEHDAKSVKRAIDLRSRPKSRTHALKVKYSTDADPNHVDDGVLRKAENSKSSTQKLIGLLKTKSAYTLTYHYKNMKLIHEFMHMFAPDQLLEHPNSYQVRSSNELFHLGQKHVIWKQLILSKNRIQPRVILKYVEKQMMALSVEEEYDFKQFQAKLLLPMIVKDRRHMGAVEKARFETRLAFIAQVIFADIIKSRRDYAPLYLFTRFPLAPTLILADLEHWWAWIHGGEYKANKNSKHGRLSGRLSLNYRPEESTLAVPSLAKMSSSQLIEFLRETGCLRLKTGIISGDDDEITQMVEGLNLSSVYSECASLHHKFQTLLQDVHELFTSQRRYSNLIRDIHDAIDHKGHYANISKGELVTIFDDVTSDEIGIIMWRSLKQDKDFIPLWTIRSYIMVIGFLNNVVQTNLIRKHSFLTVSEDELLQMVYDQYGKTIYDRAKVKRQKMLAKLSNDGQARMMQRLVGAGAGGGGGGPAAQFPSTHANMPVMSDIQMRSLGFVNDGESKEEEEAQNASSGVRPDLRSEKSVMRRIVSDVDNADLDDVSSDDSEDTRFQNFSNAYETLRTGTMRAVDFMVNPGSPKPLADELSDLSKLTHRADSAKANQKRRRRQKRAKKKRKRKNANPIQSDDDESQSSTESDGEAFSNSLTTEMLLTDISGQQERWEKKRKSREQRLKLLAERMISKTAITKIIQFIFRQMRVRRRKKLTARDVDLYQKRLCRALHNTDNLNFIVSKLMHSVNKHANHRELEQTFLSKAMFIKMVEEEIVMDAQQSKANALLLDEFCRPSSIGSLAKVYTYCLLIFKQIHSGLPRSGLSPRAAPIVKDLSMAYTQDKNEITEVFNVFDCIDILYLYLSMFTNLESINTAGTNLDISKCVFQKFVDYEYFHVGIVNDESKWSRKATEAANLFQLVLDEEYRFVTLGQVERTAKMLVSDLRSLGVGSITRLHNLICQKSYLDNDNCKVMLHQKNTRALSVNALHALQTSANPSMQFSLVNLDAFRNFIAQHRPKNDARIMLIDCYVSFADDNQRTNDPHFALLPQLNESESVKADEVALAGSGKAVAHNKMDSTELDLDLADAILAATTTDAAQKIDTKSGTGTGTDYANTDATTNTNTAAVELQPLSVGEEVKEEEEEEEVKADDVKAETSGAPDDEQYFYVDRVFHSILEKCEGRLTLQQVIEYFEEFRSFLWQDENINLKARFDSAEAASKMHLNVAIDVDVDVDVDGNEAEADSCDYENGDGTEEKFIDEYFDNEQDFRVYYFPGSTGKQFKQYASEIQWFFEECETESDLVNIWRPVIKRRFVSELYVLLNSSDGIQGNYELTRDVFVQLRHLLNLTQKQARLWYHIIRKQKTELTWKQIDKYCRFLLKLEKKCASASVRLNEGKQTDLSVDKMRLELDIVNEDESHWLFKAVRHRHGDTITWKQMQTYLENKVEMSVDERFFHNQGADEA